MNRIIIFLCLFFLVMPFTVVSAAEKPLKPEEVLKLRNYELSLQNFQLQIEVLHREIERLSRARDIYFDDLYKDYGLDKKWKIDLEKGMWVVQELLKVEKMDGKTAE